MEYGNNSAINIVIVGTQRSGTTLLQKLIAHNLQLATAFESYFIPLFDRFKFLWGNLEKTENRTKLVEAIFIYLEFRYSLADKLEPKTKAEHTLLACRGKIDQIVENSRSYADIVNSIFEIYAQIKDRPGFVEKTAYHNWPPLPKLASIFNDTLFVHIVRSPTSTFTSWKNTWFGPKYPETAARIWNKINRECADWGDTNPDKYLLIKYEDLTDNPQEQLDKIRKALSTHQTRATSARIDNQDLFSAISDKPWFKNINNQVGEKTRQNENLSGKDLEIIDRLTAHEQARYHYTPSTSKSGKVPAPRYPMEACTINACKRLVERYFPVFICALQTLRLHRFLTWTAARI